MKTIVLFGDSITDMGRWRDADTHAFSYGVGYPIFLKEKIERNNLDVKLLNRGCSGDSTTNLLERIDEDVIKNNPDIVSILIGTNDVWHLFEGDETHRGNKIDKFEENYREIISIIKSKLPKTKIFLFGSFFIPVNFAEKKDLWNHMEKLYSYVEVVEKIAKENGIPFTKLQPLMDEATKDGNVEKVLYDGIHPNVKGSVIIADTIFEQISKYIK